MDTKKLLMGTVVGGITYFILGWIIYGMILMSMMAEYNNASCMRADADMVWWAMILGNLGFAKMLTYVFLKTGNVNSFGAGAQYGLVLAVLIAASYDLMMFATSTMVSNPMGIVVDVVASGIMGAIAGGIIAMVTRAKSA